VAAQRLRDSARGRQIARDNNRDGLIVNFFSDDVGIKLSAGRAVEMPGELFPK